MERLRPSAALFFVLLVALPTSAYGGGEWNLRPRRTTTKSNTSPLPADLETSPSPSPVPSGSNANTTVDLDEKTEPTPLDKDDVTNSTTESTSESSISTSESSISTSESSISTSESSDQEESTTTRSRVTTPDQPDQPEQPDQPSKPVDFDCKTKDDGYYADPKDKCSSRYFSCLRGEVREMRCQRDLIYEPDIKKCERRKESFRCSGVRKTTVRPTPRASPLPPSQIGIDCSTLDDGWYPNPQKKCSHSFFSCNGAAGSKFICPGDNYFDKKSTSCRPFDDVFECSGKRPTHKPKPTATSAPKEKLPIDCDDLASGVYADPNNKCSRTYYVCSNGDGYKQVCPHRTYFDPEDLLCDHYDEVVACSGKRKKPSKVTLPPIPAIASLSSKEFNCTGKPNKAYLPHGQKCSRIYYRCVHGFTYRKECPQKLHFDLEMNMCEARAHVPGCNGKRRTTLKPTTVKPIPAEKLPIDCSKLKNGDHPDPTNKCSSKYYTCVHSTGTLRRCPHGTVFDKILKHCESREHVLDCNGKPRPITTKPTTRYPITKSPYKCGKKDGNFATGKCASRYYACIGGNAITADCAPNTFYDKVYDQCGYKEEIPDCGGVRPTVPVKATRRPRP